VNVVLGNVEVAERAQMYVTIDYWRAGGWRGFVYRHMGFLNLVLG
jgi:hypothetical protein